jgi:hypothetical protein
MRLSSRVTRVLSLLAIFVCVAPYSSFYFLLDFFTGHGSPLHEQDLLRSVWEKQDDSLQVNSHAGLPQSAQSTNTILNKEGLSQNSSSANATSSTTNNLTTIVPPSDTSNPINDTFDSAFLHALETLGVLLQTPPSNTKSKEERIQAMFERLDYYSNSVYHYRHFSLHQKHLPAHVHLALDWLLPFVIGMVLQMCLFIFLCFCRYQQRQRTNLSYSSRKANMQRHKERKMRVQEHVEKYSCVLGQDGLAHARHEDLRAYPAQVDESVSTVHALDQEDTGLIPPAPISGMCRVIEKAITTNSHNLTIPRELSTISKNCAICLQTYQKGERVSWSPHSHCVHVFHTECILTWVFRTLKLSLTAAAGSAQGSIEPSCPCCRQVFISIPDVE